MAAESGTEVVLVGREDVVEAELVAAGADLEVLDAPEVVEMQDDPAKAVRDKPGSSILTASRLVASRRADALVSAGSTGAAIAAASIVIGRIKGVLRPAIATPIPRPGKPVLLLDAGANLEVRPVHLVQFGVMGALLAEIVYGVERPRVGLLNIGSEPAKGRDVERSAFGLLEEAPITFVGNLEGGDVDPRESRRAGNGRFHRQRRSEDDRGGRRAGGPPDGARLRATAGERDAAHSRSDAGHLRDNRPRRATVAPTW